ncbi:hypothetical protein V6N13_148254 [Hibiscus sabdariffa]|uniref:Uncharacterized protein n=1 Tax=Hibiscus sabdariffa TaxID=183260 RepID=A0ABR2TY01_9ROSI
MARWMLNGSLFLLYGSSHRTTVSPATLIVASLWSLDLEGGSLQRRERLLTSKAFVNVTINDLGLLLEKEDGRLRTPKGAKVWQVENHVEVVQETLSATTLTSCLVITVATQVEAISSTEKKICSRDKDMEVRVFQESYFKGRYVECNLNKLGETDSYGELLGKFWIWWKVMTLISESSGGLVTSLLPFTVSPLLINED